MALCVDLHISVADRYTQRKGTRKKEKEDKMIEGGKKADGIHFKMDGTFFL